MSSDYPRHTCIHQLFEVQAARTPNAVALTFEDTHLTYCQLNRRANQFAQYLRGLGVGPEVLVGICVERSLDMLVGLLGILKAGGAYVSLDPSYPIERLAFMLEDAQVPVLVAQTHLLGKLPAMLQPPCCNHGADVRPTICGVRHVVRLDADWPAIAQLSVENTISNVAGDNLAYVLYTSGSTGRPKGVLIEHAGVCNQLHWRQAAYPLTGDDRVLHAASLSFDISVWELFGPLLAGAQIVMLEPGQQRNIADLAALMARRQITILQLPTPLLRVLLDEPVLAACDRLRHIFCGGETLTVETQERCFTQLPGAALHNLYGPTEATIEATFWDCRPNYGQASIPIGWPIANKQVYILNKQLAPVPIGTPGELHIGGVGLARGYLNRPELTTEKFIPNPFADLGLPESLLLQNPKSKIQNSRLYRTGDLARYRPDGAIEFLGRIDQQVKVRGFRIELGEIETVLLRHPLVRQAIVLAREDTPGHKRLVAYVVVSPLSVVNSQSFDISTHQPGCGQRTTDNGQLTSELRAFLKDRLPDYMLPSAFVPLDALPLTPNGKLDRAALPPPKYTLAGLDARVAAVPITEALLAQIWADVLGLDQVGAHDNFFELGGDSILSIQLIARARQAGLRVSPKQLFEHPTVAGLAAVAGVAPALLADQGTVTGPVPLTPIQRWFFEQNFPNPHHWNQALLLELPPDTDAALLERAFQHLLVQHDALNLCFTGGDDGWRQVNTSPGASVPFRRADLSKLPAPAQRSAIEAAAAELQSSLDLAQAPRLCATVFDLGADRSARLLIVVNYLAIDGVSWRILLEDLQNAYQQLRGGPAVTLPPKTTSYQQWARRLADYARSNALRQQLTYWLDEIRHAEPAIPLDHPDGANTIASAHSVSISLSADETRALLHEVPKTYHTQINDVLLAALLRAWAEWTGSRSLLITLESHGREDLFDDVDLSRTVGWFTSFFPLLLQQASDEDPAALLIATKERLRQVPDHGIGYGLLRYLADDGLIAEQLRALPRPVLRFNYLGQFDQVLSGASLFRRARESSGPTRSPSGQRTHVLVAEGLVAEGQLHFTWTYSANLHHHDTIAQLADRYLAELRALIEHCLTPGEGAFTPSDFVLAGLNQQQLDDVAALLSDLDDGDVQ